LRSFRPWLFRPIFGLAKLLIRHWERPVRELRRELSLPPLRRPAMFEGQFSPLVNLALFDRLLALPQPDWPQPLTVCGAPLHDGPPADDDVLDDLAEFLAAGEPPLVFALGSSAVWMAGFRPEAISAARSWATSVLITGAEQLGPPPKVRAFPSPYSRIFPAAAANISADGTWRRPRAG
jgi:hypothetical protein